MPKKIIKYNNKKNYRRVMFFRNIRNYHMTKLSAAFRIVLDNTQCHIYFGDNDANDMSFANFLTACKDWDAYRRIFANYKVESIYFTFKPIPVNEVVSNATTTTGTFPITGFSITDLPYFGMISQGDGTNIEEIAESNKSTILSYTNDTHLYIKFKGGMNNWMGTSVSTFPSIKFAVAVKQNNGSGTLRWVCRVDFNILFKNFI